MRHCDRLDVTIHGRCLPKLIGVITFHIVDGPQSDAAPRRIGVAAEVVSGNAASTPLNANLDGIANHRSRVLPLNDRLGALVIGRDKPHILFDSQHQSW